LIALACRRLKADGRDLLVSYADAGEGHHGGVYQASGWNYDGQRAASIDGLTIDGQFIPGRTCNSIYGTRSPSKVRTLLGQNVEPHIDIGKHLYWRALNRAGEAKALRLGLKCLPYPKPNAKG
jgi:hypothetical protein